MDSNYIGSNDIHNSIIEYKSVQGLNGFLLLSYLGSHPDRTDKFYNKLDDLIVELINRGYEFTDLESSISLVKRY